MKNEQQHPRSTKKSEQRSPRPQASPPRPAAAPVREPDPRERAENEGMTAPAPESGTGSAAMEGEGSYSATHHYREGLERSVKKGDAEELADRAAKALDGPEGAELRRAEHAAKQGHVSPAPRTKTH